MQQIASRTGGQFFEAKKKDNLDEIYNQIAASLRQQYLLTYTPDKVDTDGKFHKIVLKTDKCDLNVITREGYYAPTPDKYSGDCRSAQAMQKGPRFSVGLIGSAVLCRAFLEATPQRWGFPCGERSGTPWPLTAIPGCPCCCPPPVCCGALLVFECEAL